MISENEYKEALTIVNEYRNQFNKSVANGDFDVNIYEWLKAEMMATTNITLEEFDEVLEIWCNIKRKELSIAKFYEEQHNKKIA